MQQRAGSNVWPLKPGRKPHSLRTKFVARVVLADNDGARFVRFSATAGDHSKAGGEPVHHALPAHRVQPQRAAVP